MRKEKENWKPIKGFEGFYEISDLGRVRSIDRVVEFNRRNGTVVSRRTKGRLLHPGFDGKKNYLHVTLSRGKIRTVAMLHRLVAEAFIENPNALPEVNHKDEDKTNNAVDNLEWCDHIYNNNYGKKMFCHQGENNPQCKFPIETILAIKREYDPTKEGGRICDLSRKYGVSQPHIRSIITGFRWGWLE